MIELKFRWSDRKEEGCISAADRQRLLEIDSVLAGDFLIDVLHETEKLFNEIVSKRNVER